MNMAIDIGIDQDARTRVADGLAATLADSYTLYLKTHGYHWNVTGPHFTALHGLFEAQYTELAAAVDTIAERIRALGAPAPGSYGAYAALTSVIEDEPGAVPAAMVMIENLVHAHETVIRNLRALLPVAENAGDEVTVDLLTARLSVHEQTAWMLRSHLG